VSEHVDIETMSDFRENLLPERQAARVAAHLSSCARCADADAQFAGVSALLASTPVPPMPATLTARIQAALAAEAAARSPAAHTEAAHTEAAADLPAGAGPTAAHAGTGTARPTPAGSHDRPAHGARRGRRPAWSPGFSRLALRASAVAATVVILASAGYGLTRLTSHSQSGTSASSALAPTRSPGTSARGSQSLPLPAAKVPGGSLPLVASGTNYQPGQIAAQASAVLSRRLSSESSMGAPASGTHTAPFGDFRNVRACVTRVTGGTMPRLVDAASYRGQPALAIMVSAGGGATRVWVVGAGCSATASDVLAQATLPGSS
jgi:Putative zinc-finger